MLSLLDIHIANHISSHSRKKEISQKGLFFTFLAKIEFYFSKSF